MGGAEQGAGGGAGTRGTRALSEQLRPGEAAAMTTVVAPSSQLASAADRFTESLHEHENNPNHRILMRLPNGRGLQPLDTKPICAVRHGLILLFGFRSPVSRRE